MSVAPQPERQFRRTGEETCVASLRFPGDVAASLTAGYVKSAEEGSWQVRVYGSAATLEISPSEMGSGGLRLLRGTGGEVFGFAESENGFRRQAEAFLDTIGGGGVCRNTPSDALGDLRIAEAIRTSVRQRVMVEL